MEHFSIVTSAAELKRRWYEPENAGLRMAVLEWLRGHGRKPGGLAEVDGRVDLRGIPLTASPVTFGGKDDPAAGVRWSSLDLRRAQLDGLRFFAARVENCLFDSANLMDLRLWGTEVVDCSFRHAEMSGGLGSGEWSGRRNIWRRVVFEGTKLGGSGFTGCVLEECRFEKNDRRLLIEDSEVIACTFRGHFDSLLVDRRGYRWAVDPRAFSADFSAATFTDSHIVGYSLDQVQLPKQPELIVIPRYQPVLQKAVLWLSEHATNEAEGTARDILEMWIEPPGSDLADLCFDLRGIDPAVGEGVRLALSHATR